MVMTRQKYDFSAAETSCCLMVTDTKNVWAEGASYFPLTGNPG